MGPEHRAASFERFLYEHRRLIVLLLTVMYFTGTILRARGKPFWFDEIITLLEARQSSAGAAIQAGRDLDLMPPLAPLTGYFVNKVLGHSEAVFRLPAMIGFWVFSLCLFGIAARRVTICFAFVAMLLPFATAFESYAFEARSYGVMLGFCGVALLCWHTAANEQKRVISLVGLALGIAGALLNHYYAIMIYLPLAGAELFRSFQRRKLDWPMWIAFLAGAIPLVASLLKAIHVIKGNPTSWSQAHTQDYLIFYTTVFAYSLAFAIPAVVLWAAWLVAGGSKEEPVGLPQPSIPRYELVASVLLLLIPAGAITLALVVKPHIYMPRYAIPAIGGFALLSSFLTAHLAQRRSTIRIVFLAAAMLPFLFDLSHGRAFQNPFDQEPVLRQALQKGPVVINDNLSFLELWYYAPEELKPRILYLSSEQLSVKYEHADNYMAAYQKFGVPVVDYQQFATPGKQFLLYLTPGFGWVPEKVIDDAGTLEIVQWDHGKGLLKALLK